MKRHLAIGAFIVFEQKPVTDQIATMKELRTAGETREPKDDWFEYAILWNRHLLAPLGVWPLDRRTSRSEQNRRLIRLGFSSWLLILYIIPQYLFLLTRGSVEACLETLAPETFIFLAVIKFVILIWNSEKIGYCIDCVRCDWANVKLEEDRTMMIENVKTGRFMTICCFGGMYAVLMIYTGGMIYTTIMPFFKSDTNFVEGNASITERPLPYPIKYIFFNEQSSPVYEITWIVQVFGSSYVCMLNYGGYALIGFLVTHACCQLRIIVSQLEDLTDGNRGEFHSFAQRIAAIVEHHTYVIRYVEFVNKSFQVILLMDDIGTLAMICFVGFRTIQHWNRDDSTLDTVVDVSIGMCVIFNLFIVSFVGQRLVDESQLVRFATIRVQSYRLPPAIARSLIMCIISSTRPLKLSAYSVIDMSLANFGEVLKSSYVFLNMLQKVTDV